MIYIDRFENNKNISKYLNFVTLHITVDINIAVIILRKLYWKCLLYIILEFSAFSKFQKSSQFLEMS